MQLRTVLFAASTLLLAACADQDLVGPVESPSFKRGQAQGPSRHIVVFVPDAAVPADFKARVEALGGTVVTTIDDGVAIVDITSSGAARLARSQDVESVEEDVRVQLDPTRRVVMDFAAVDAVAMSPSNPATALAYNAGLQWHYRVVGADRAWAAGNIGSSNVKVAILDSGIDPTHPDLAGRVHLTLSRSFLPATRLDPDVPTDQELINQFFPNAQPWTDLNGHGTHVGSTVSSNSFIFAGMSTQTTLIAVKVLGHDGSGSFSSILTGIRYAADVGAQVINMSLGATFTKALGGGLHGALDRTVKYAAKKGALVVVAAGNSAAPMDQFHPSVYFALCETKTVLCVSATGPSTGVLFNVYPVALPLPAAVQFDQFAIYSNFGSDVDIAAPGGNYEILRDANGRPILDEDGNEQIISGHFVVQPCSLTLVDLAGTNKTPCASSPFFLFGAVGTSQAAPHVSGLAALLLARMPGTSAEALRAIMLSSADDRGAPGIDPLYGSGRVNVARALGVE